jgi:hypothetical protein
MRRVGLDSRTDRRLTNLQARASERNGHAGAGPGRRRLLRLADRVAPLSARPRYRHRRRPVAATDRRGARRSVSDPDRATGRAHRRVAGGRRTDDRPVRAHPRARLRRAGGAVDRLAARRGRPLRRTTRRALFDEVGAQQALHGRQQRLRHPRPFGGRGRVRPRHPHRPPRDHGRLRLRRDLRGHSRGLPEGAVGEPRRLGGTGDPAPGGACTRGSSGAAKRRRRGQMRG